jgi:hypothetical protein
MNNKQLQDIIACSSQALHGLCKLGSINAGEVVLKQYTKGLEAYGKPLSEAGFSRDRLLQEAAEELVDALAYLTQALKENN